MKARRLDKRGVTSVEFGLLILPLLAMLAGVIEVSAQGAVAAALDYGARRASRMGITGGDENGTIATDAAARKEALLQRVLSSTAGVLLDPTQLTLEETSYNNSSDASLGKNKTSGPGTAGQLVRYKLTYTQPLLMPALTGLLFPQSQYTHESTILVQNEPFPTK